MSHFYTVKTKLNDRELLVKALCEMGWRADQIEVHPQAQHLYGYTGDRRKQTAEVIIRRQHVGDASNDIGFKLQPDGSYAAVISEYDRDSLGYNKQWLGRLAQNFMAHKSLRSLERQGLRGNLVRREDGKVEIRAQAAVRR